MTCEDWGSIDLRDLVKFSFENVNAYISERGVTLFLEDLKSSNEIMIEFAFIKYIQTQKTTPPTPRDIRTLIIEGCFDRSVKVFGLEFKEKQIH